MRAHTRRRGDATDPPPAHRPPGRFACVRSARFVRRSLAAQSRPVALRVGSPPPMYATWLAMLLRHPGSWSSLTSCPTDELMHDGQWRYRFTARPNGTEGGGGRAGSHSAAPPTRSVTLSGSGDPGYHFTAVSLAEVALCLAGVHDSAPSAGGGNACRGPRGGVLSPAMAVNVTALVARYVSIGLMRVDVHSAPEEAAGDGEAALAAEGELAAKAVEASAAEAAVLARLGGATANEVATRRGAALEMLLQVRGQHAAAAERA